MSPLFVTTHGIVRFPRSNAVGERDARGELVRVRLADSTLDRVSAIQDYYSSAGLPTTMQRVIADAIDTHYASLSAQGKVPPNL